MKSLALVAAVLAAGCMATTHRRDLSSAPSAERSGPSGGSAERCRDLAVLASIEVYPIGLNPQRRFEAIGVVETGPEGSATRRVSSLQAQACSLGADAVIGWSEEGLGRGLATAFQHGTTIVSIGDGRPVTASGIAVVYTDQDDRERLAAETASADLWDPTSDL